MPMTLLALLLAISPIDDPATLPDHEANAAYQAVRAEGITAGGASARLPEPNFPDGQDAEAQLAALRNLAGSDRAVEDFLRDSVTAPHLLKRNDVRGDEGKLLGGDLYYVLHVDFERLDASELQGGPAEGKPIEAGNMRFEGRVLDPGESDHIRSVELRGRLLDRILVETTIRLSASRSSESILVAATPEPGRPGLWRTTGREGDGPPEPYAGGIAYTKVTRLKGLENAVIVEAHFAIAEPLGWFNGAPILSSKISPIAQDQVRKLRRELKK